MNKITTDCPAQKNPQYKDLRVGELFRYAGGNNEAIYMKTEYVKPGYPSSNAAVALRTGSFYWPDGYNTVIRVPKATIEVECG